MEAQYQWGTAVTHWPVSNLDYWSLAWWYIKVFDNVTWSRVFFFFWVQICIHLIHWSDVMFNTEAPSHLSSTYFYWSSVSCLIITVIFGESWSISSCKLMWSFNFMFHMVNTSIHSYKHFYCRTETYSVLFSCFLQFYSYINIKRCVIYPFSNLSYNFIYYKY